MKAIVTQAYDDGTFAEVGMNTRRIVGPLKSQRGLRNRARRVFPTGVLRMEYFYGNRIPTDPDQKPFKVEFTR